MRERSCTDSLKSPATTQSATPQLRGGARLREGRGPGRHPPQCAGRCKQLGRGAWRPAQWPEGPESPPRRPRSGRRQCRPGAP
eukprot:1214705-Alexandrium_andersonii.AAC.1